MFVNNEIGVIQDIPEIMRCAVVLGSSSRRRGPVTGSVDTLVLPPCRLT
jgi:hypothetical protein